MRKFILRNKLTIVVCVLLLVFGFAWWVWATTVGTDIDISGSLKMDSVEVITSGKVLQNVTTATSTITSGTFGVARGGTGLSSLTQGYIPFGKGTSAFGSSANLFWDETNSRLGIGTTTPSGLLHARKDSADTQVLFDSTEDMELVVKGDRNNDDESKHGWVTIYQDGTARWVRIGVGEAGNDNQGFIASYDTLDIFVGSTWPATTPAMTILSSGNVGIGTSDPSEKLHVVGNISATTNTADNCAWTSATCNYSQTCPSYKFVAGVQRHVGSSLCGTAPKEYYYMSLYCCNI